MRYQNLPGERPNLFEDGGMIHPVALKIVLASLLNEINENDIELALTLDDYHLIKETSAFWVIFRIMRQRRAGN